MKSSFRIVRLALGILAALATGLVASDVAFAQTASPAEISIVLSSNSIAGSSMRLVNQLGLLERNGVKAHFVFSDSGNAALAALVGGSSNFATVAMDDLIPLRAKGQQDVAIVVNAYRGVAGVIVVRKDVADKLPAKPTDSAEARVKALDGLILAATSATSGMVGPLRLALHMVGANVRFTYMQLPAMFPALKTGAIQAYIATSPFWEQAVEDGVAVRWLSGPQGEFPPSTVTASALSLVTTTGYAHSHPDVIKHIRAAYDQFAALIHEHPDQVLAALKQLYPDLPPRVVELSFQQNSPAWARPDLSEADIRKEIDMRKGGNIPNLDKIDPATVVLPR
jgi:ABC-type nitrate/sulfonate/bicarbonate transport system substrate-binding protein